MGKRLENWFIRFVTIKNGVKGLINIANYVFDDSHINHQKNEHQIVAFEKHPRTVLKNMLFIQKKKELETVLKRKGGRPATYGKSLLISFPSEIKLSDQDYQEE